MKEIDIRDPNKLNKWIQISSEESKLFDNNKFVHINCPLCGCGQEKYEFQKNGFTYVSCVKCGTLFTNPRPTDEQLNLFYSTSESSVYFANEFYEPYAEARRKNIFLPRVESVVSEFSEYNRGGYRIGDIGAGTGIFLEELGKIWINAEMVAIEPSNEAVKICKSKGLSVIPCMFDEIHPSDIKFDMLFSFELFEHLNNPEVFINKAYELLNHGGILLITTLNGKGFDILTLWENHPNIHAPAHLNFANPYAIRLLLEKTGFEIISITTPGKLDWDIVERRIKSNEVSIGRWWDQVCELDEKAKEDFQKWIRDNNLSSHMRIVARKI